MQLLLNYCPLASTHLHKSNFCECSFFSDTKLFFVADMKLAHHVCLCYNQRGCFWHWIPPCTMSSWTTWSVWLNMSGNSHSMTCNMQTVTDTERWGNTAGNEAVISLIALLSSHPFCVTFTLLVHFNASDSCSDLCNTSNNTSCWNSLIPNVKINQASRDSCQMDLFSVWPTWEPSCRHLLHKSPTFCFQKSN